VNRLWVKYGRAVMWAANVTKSKCANPSTIANPIPKLIPKPKH